MEILNIFTRKLRYRRYAERTIEVYVGYVKEYLVSNQVSDPYRVTTKDINSYLEHRSYSSASVQNQVIGSLKAYAKHILNRSDVHLNKIKRVKPQTKIQPVIPRQLLLEKLAAVGNVKHRTIIAVAYVCALRVSELINLQWKHISRAERVIYIINSKGGKDRIVPLTDTLISLLEHYWKIYKTQTYIFAGQDWRQQYSPASCNKIVKQVFGPTYRFHSLRKSSATHRYELGDDLAKIQDLLGHVKEDTTRTYIDTSALSINHLTDLLTA